MDIVVVGYSKKKYVPNEVEIRFTFNEKGKKYDEVVELGTDMVSNYLDFLVKLGFKKENCKTLNMRVSENKEYNDAKRIYISNGYIFSQNVKLKFDYDVKILAEIIEKTSMLDNPPTYVVNFNVKNEEKVIQELYAEAVADAKTQAQILADASGLKLSKCLKISTDPEEKNSYCSRSSYEGSEKKYKCSSVSQSIQSNFTPENVLIECGLYVIWFAE